MSYPVSSFENFSLRQVIWLDIESKTHQGFELVRREVKNKQAQACDVIIPSGMVAKMNENSGSLIVVPQEVGDFSYDELMDKVFAYTS